MGVFTCSILASIVTILVSIVAILMSIEPSFEAILKRFSVRINFKNQFQSNDLGNTVIMI